MKRDELLDFAFGGNKVRMLECIAADVVKKGAKDYHLREYTFKSYPSGSRGCVQNGYSLRLDYPVQKRGGDWDHLTESEACGVLQGCACGIL